MWRHTVLFCSALLLLIACNEKPIPPTAPLDSTTVINDTVYTPIRPAWTGFRKPSDILIGREPFIYVADTENDRVVMLDLAGRFLGAKTGIKRPVAIAQDGVFDLLVCGELDTTIGGNPLTVGAIYRIQLRKTAHRIETAPVKIAYMELQKPQRRFTGITVLPDNSYLVTRTGPSNLSPIDPDDAVIQISAHDQFISPVPILRPVGNALNSLQQPSGISVVGDRTYDFVFTQIGADMQFKVQWLEYRGGEISDWRPKFTPADNTDFLRVGRFVQPEDVTYDQFGNIYVIDAGKDSLLKFNYAGIEFRHSFGGTGSELNQFRNPRGVAFYDGILYIADTGNDRILRFRLSSDY